MTLLALLALVASVLIWAAPSSQAQGNEQPYANAGTDQTLNAGATDAVDLDGTGSIDVDDDTDPNTACTGCEYKWEIETGPYDWIEISNDDNAQTAEFTMPSQAFVDKVSDSDPQKYEIVVRLTVTDDDGATDSDTVSININQRPVADIQLFAGLRDEDLVDPDTSTKERYSIPGVIDGPGENGNRDNEWDIMEGSYLQLSGAGSTDENPTTGRPATYQWQLASPANAPTGFAASQAAAGADNLNFEVGTIAETTDLNDDGDTDDAGESVNVLPTETVLPRQPVTVFYTLTVTDSTRLTGQSLIRIVVHDTSATPEVEIEAGLTAASTGRGDTKPQGTVSQFTGVENQFIVAAGSTVVLTANVEDDDQGVLGTARDNGTTHSGHSYRWSGAAQRDDDATTVDIDEKNSATVRIPADADDGDTIDVSVTVTDATRISVTTEIQLLVGENTPPTAGGVPANQGSIDSVDNPATTEVDESLGGPVIWVHSVTDGFQNRRDGSTVTLRGVGNDADGDSIITAWAQREAPDPEAFNTAVEAWMTAIDAIADDADAVTRATAVATANGTFLAAQGAALADMQDPEEPLLELNGALTDTVSFDVPNLTNAADGSRGTILLFTVIDSKGVASAQLVYIHISNDDDPPDAKAGDDQQVDPEAFVRLNGSASSDPDVGDGNPLTYSWAFTGATMDPAPDDRSPLSADEIDELEGWILRKATVNDDAKDIFEDSDGNAYVYIVNSAGQVTGESDNLNATDTAYPWFDAPDLTGFNNITLTFTLTVTDSADDPRDESVDLNDDGDTDDTVDGVAEADLMVPESDSDTVTITVVNRFFSGNIPGPDYCTGLSLGGPATSPFDSDDDGVADTCSLSTTRRATVARQNALETLANLNPAEFRTAVLAECGAPGFKQRNYGDDPADLDSDVCETERVTPPPVEVDPADADVFYSGTITGPDFCTNHSLGGARTYGYDSDEDGVADTCSLSTTRREAIARQNGLNSFIESFSAAEQTGLTERQRLVELEDTPDADITAGSDEETELNALRAKYGAEDRTEDVELTEEERAAVDTSIEALTAKQAKASRYSNAVDAACRALGTQDFGDAASALARDACAPKAGPTGTPLS